MNKRSVCRWLVALLAFVLTRAATAQSAPTASTGLSMVGPTLTQTAEWLKKQLPILGLDVVEARAADGRPRLEVHRLDNVTLSRCRLTVREWLKWDTNEFPPTTITIPLADVDVARIGVSAATLPQRMMGVSYQVSIFVVIRERGPRVTRETPGTSTSVSAAFLHMRDEDAAHQAANAFRHAASLCGAADASAKTRGALEGVYVGPQRTRIEIQANGNYNLQRNVSPVVGTYTLYRDTLVLIAQLGERMQSYVIGNMLLLDDFSGYVRADAVVPAAAAPAVATVPVIRSSAAPARPVTTPATIRPPGLTNEDIAIEVGSGARHEVMATAIRQATDVAFDVSLTALVALRNAGVPDVVILAMQERQKGGALLVAKATAAPQAIAVDSRNAETVYWASQSNGLYASDNGGATWIRPLGGGNVIATMAIASSGSPKIYVSANGGSFMSRNGARTWTRLSIDVNTVSQFAIDPRNSDIVFAAGSKAGKGVLLKSTNAGLRWSVANGRLPIGSINVLAMNPRRPATIYAAGEDGIVKSGDGGATWKAVNSGLDAIGLNVVSMVLDPADTTVLYAGTANHGVFRSSNAGSSWTALNNGLPTSTETATHIAIDPRNPGVLYVSTVSAGLFRTDDRGNNWYPLSAGAPGTRIDAITVVPGNPSVLYVANQMNFLKSIDGGATWTFVGRPIR